MDIARIRKKAQGKEQEKKPEDPAGEEPSVKKPESPPAEQTARENPPAKDTGEMAEKEVKSAFDRPIEDRGETVTSPQGPGSAVPEIGATEEDEEEMVELLMFSLSSEDFAFKVSDIEEIVRFQRITRVPTMPKYVLGITSLRGKIIPVLDLKVKLGISDGGAREKVSETGHGDEDSEFRQKIVIVLGPKGLIGATIDSVEGVLRASHSRILPPPGHLTEEEQKYIEGVVISNRKFVSILRAGDAMNIEGS